jgi:ketosteroid isomerase-like protein
MKKLFTFAIIITLTSACNKRLEETKIVDTSTQNKALIEEYYAHFNKHDWQKVTDMYADKPTMKDPAYGIENVLMTKAEILKKYTELSQQIPDVRDSIINMYHAGNNVIVEFESKGTGPDGKPFVVPICTIFEFQNGKISKDLTYYDNF